MGELTSTMEEPEKKSTESQGMERENKRTWRKK